jgi:hypothetical protein
MLAMVDLPSGKSRLGHVNTPPWSKNLLWTPLVHLSVMTRNERFDAALKKIAAHKPPERGPDHKPEKQKPVK